MAKKARRKALSKSGVESGFPTSVPVKLILDPSPNLEFSYVNFAEVGHSKHEFFVLLGRGPTKANRADILMAQKTGEVHVEATVQFLLPPTLMPGLIRALTLRKEHYEQEYGPIRDDSDSSKEASRGE